MSELTKRKTYEPSGLLKLSLWEPVLLVDSRIPYGADKEKLCQTQTSTCITSLHMCHLRSVIMASKTAAFLHTDLDASDTMTSKYIFSVPYCRRLALMFSSGPRHFWFLRLDLPER